MKLVHLVVHSLQLSSYLNYDILLFNKDTSNLAELRDTPIQAVTDCWTHWMKDRAWFLGKLPTCLVHSMCAACVLGQTERKMSAGWEPAIINPQEPWASSIMKARK